MTLFLNFMPLLPSCNGVKQKIFHKNFLYSLRNMSVNVQTTDIQSAPGVTLDDKQKLLVGSVLDVIQNQMFL
jgi:hypothetical protein